MSWICKYVNSSIGKKQLMAVTGGCLLGFLLVHTVGNASLLIPDEAARHEAFMTVANTYASMKFLLYIAEAGLVVLFGTHIFNAIRTKLENMKARGNVAYDVKVKVGDRSLPSFTMVISGLYLFAWLVVHICTIKFGLKLFPEAMTEGIGRSVENIDLYDVYVYWMAQWWYALTMTIAMVLVGFHLWHGAGSLFQTLGLRHPKYTPVLEVCTKAYALFVSVATTAICVTVFIRGVI